MENYPDFEKLVHIIQHGLQEFIVKNIEGESMEANNLSHDLLYTSGSVAEMLQTF